MRKLFSSTKLTIFFLLIMGSMLSVLPAKVWAATVRCDSITYTIPSISVANPTGGDGSMVPVNVSVNIRVSGATDYDLDDGYRLAYDDVGRGGGWREIVTPLTPIGGGAYQASATMNIDSFGEWQYVFETVIDSTESIGTGPGCSPDVNPARFQVNPNPLPDPSWFNTLCEGLPGPVVDVLNHYSCLGETGVDGSTRWGFNGTNICADGFEPDIDSCQAGVDPTGAPLSAPIGACLPCRPEGSSSVNILPHLAECTPGDAVNVCGSDLECRIGDHIDDGKMRCLYTTARLNQGEQCYLGSFDECNTIASYYCQPDPASGLSYVGKCVSDVLIDQCTGDTSCKEYLGDDRAYCDIFSGVCRIKDTSTTTTAVIPPSNQFGACRCANVECLDETEKPTQDSSNARLVRPKTGITEQQRADALACISCTNAGNTWTDSLGCVTTTPNGVFITILRIAIGVIGGVSLFRLMLLGYQLNFGAKEADIKKSQEDILGILGGILLAIFGILLLRIIGVNILDVVPPGFFGT